MRYSRITLAALAAVITIASAPADAHRFHRTAASPGLRVDVAAIPAYPTSKNHAHAVRQASRHWRGGTRTASRRVHLASATPEPSLGQRTIGGYAVRPSDPAPFGSGLITVSTAAGINITCAPGFAGEAQSLIADAVGRGMRFSRITCYSKAGTHVRGSNHRDGHAMDTHPSIPADLTRQHGLRSGCDFHDCMHVDDAKNVGGMAFWNSVKHGGARRVRYARR